MNIHCHAQPLGGNRAGQGISRRLKRGFRKRYKGNSLPRHGIAATLVPTNDTGHFCGVICHPSGNEAFTAHKEVTRQRYTADDVTHTHYSHGAQVGDPNKELRRKRCQWADGFDPSRKKKRIVGSVIISSLYLSLDRPATTLISRVLHYNYLFRNDSTGIVRKIVYGATSHHPME